MPFALQLTLHRYLALYCCWAKYVRMYLVLPCVYTEEDPPDRRRCHERAQDIDDNIGVNRPRQWTRSQSPLRHLLTTGSTNRPGSPPRLRHGEESGVTNEDTSCERHCGEQASNSSPMLQTASTMAPVELRPGHVFGASSTQHEPKQQQQQQQHRVCMKNVSHPVSYDECHIPAEDQTDEDTSSTGIARAETIVPLSPAVVAAVTGSCSSKNDDNDNDNATENEPDNARPLLARGT